MSETVHQIKIGSLVQCKDTDKIGCVVQIRLTEKDFVCHVSWGDGTVTEANVIDLDLLDNY